jgi:ankyrin repeat protein
MLRLINMNKDKKLIDELAQASWHGTPLDIYKCLVKGANPNARLTKNGITPIMLAARNGLITNVMFLKLRGADINALTDWNYNALMWASFNGHVSVVDYLIKCGADVLAIDKYGSTARTEASQKNNREIVKMLKKAEENQLARTQTTTNGLDNMASFKRQE